MFKNLVPDAGFGAALGALAHCITSVAKIMSGTPYNPSESDENLRMHLIAAATLNVIARGVLNANTRNNLLEMVSSGLKSGLIYATGSAAAVASGLVELPVSPAVAYGGAAFSFAVGALYSTVRPAVAAGLERNA